MDIIETCKNCKKAILSVDGKIWTHVVLIGKSTYMAINSKCVLAEPYVNKNMLCWLSVELK